ncbi:MAG TPA: hypothetical protein VMS01_16090 [Stellaceae bacterium]|nr:hypothetical protein [Stellaceae bacterium]
MKELPIRPPSEDHDGDSACAYILGENGDRRSCGAARRLGSPYCPDHHALCHVSCGTAEEIKRLREVEALANAVGGRRTRNGGGPSRRFLSRLEHTVRGFL